MRADDERAIELAVAENLDPALGVGHEARGEEVGRRHLGPRVEHVEVLDVHRMVRRSVRVEEADTALERQAHDHRQRAALEARSGLPTRSSLLALCTLTGGLAAAGSVTPAEAAALLAGARVRPQLVQFQLWPP